MSETVNDIAADEARYERQRVEREEPLRLPATRRIGRLEDAPTRAELAEEGDR